MFLSCGHADINIAYIGAWMSKPNTIGGENLRAGAEDIVRCRDD